VRVVLYAFANVVALNSIAPRRGADYANAVATARPNVVLPNAVAVRVVQEPDPILGKALTFARG
jgi:hypothetical protein